MKSERPCDPGRSGHFFLACLYTSLYSKFSLPISALRHQELEDLRQLLAARSPFCFTSLFTFTSLRVCVAVVTRNGRLRPRCRIHPPVQRRSHVAGTISRSIRICTMFHQQLQQVHQRRSKSQKKDTECLQTPYLCMIPKYYFTVGVKLLSPRGFMRVCWTGKTAGEGPKIAVLL